MRLKLTLLASVVAVGSASFVLCQTASATQPSGPIVLAQQQPNTTPEQKKQENKPPPPHRPAPPQHHAPQAPKPPPAAHPAPQRPAGPPPGAHPPQPPHVNAPQAPRPTQPPHAQPPRPPVSAQPKVIQAPPKPNNPPPPNAGRPNPPPNAGHPASPPNGARPDHNRGPNNTGPGRSREPNNARPDHRPGPNGTPPNNPAPQQAPNNPAAQRQNNRPGAAIAPQQDRGPQPPNGNAAQNRPGANGPNGPNGPKHIDQVRAERKETKEGNRTIIREDNRTILRQNNTTIIRHDDSDRFRRNARNVQVRRQGNVTRTEIVRPNGERIVTETDASGRPLRRVRVVNGRQYVLFDNRHDRHRHRDERRGNGFNFIIALPPPVIHIPRDRYIVDVDRAPPALIYDTLVAPPVEQIAEPFTLDEVLYNDTVRERMPRLDLDTITFETGSWDIAPGEAQLLAPIAEAMRRAISRDPNEVYLIEGHTDAVGSPEDNLSLSDRRAEAVAEVLTGEFGIPPENMVTQGYGEQYLKVPTEGPSQANRRVTIRRITPLLAQQ